MNFLSLVGIMALVWSALVISGDLQSNNNAGNAGIASQSNESKVGSFYDVCRKLKICHRANGETSDQVTFPCLYLQKKELTSFDTNIVTEMLVNYTLSCSKIKNLEVAFTFAPYITLTDLNLNNNCIRYVGEEIKELKDLTHIRLKGNLLEEFPKALITLPELRHINLSCNQIKKIPNEIVQIAFLRSLVLDKNPLEGFPEIVERFTPFQLSVDFCIKPKNKEVWRVIASGEIYSKD